MVEALIGLSSEKSGDILLDGKPIQRLTTRQRREHGLALIPEDRNSQGLSKSMTLWENLASGDYYRRPASNSGMLRLGYLRAQARDLIQRFDVRTPHEQVVVGALSQPAKVIAATLKRTVKISVFIFFSC